MQEEYNISGSVGMKRDEPGIFIDTDFVDEDERCSHSFEWHIDCDGQDIKVTHVGSPTVDFIINDLVGLKVETASLIRELAPNVDENYIDSMKELMEGVWNSIPGGPLGLSILLENLRAKYEAQEIGEQSWD